MCARRTRPEPDFLGGGRAARDGLVLAEALGVEVCRERQERVDQRGVEVGAAQAGELCRSRRRAARRPCRDAAKAVRRTRRRQRRCARRVGSGRPEDLAGSRCRPSARGGSARSARPAGRARIVEPERMLAPIVVCVFMVAHSAGSSLPGFSRIVVVHADLADVVQQRWRGAAARPRTAFMPDLARRAARIGGPCARCARRSRRRATPRPRRAGGRSRAPSRRRSAVRSRTRVLEQLVVAASRDGGRGARRARSTAIAPTAPTASAKSGAATSHDAAAVEGELGADEEARAPATTAARPARAQRQAPARAAGASTRAERRAGCPRRPVPIAQRQAVQWRSRSRSPGSRRPT